MPPRRWLTLRPLAAAAFATKVSKRAMASNAQQVLAQLDEDSVVYQLNTLPLPGCLVLSRADELRDGLVFAEIMCACEPQLSLRELAALTPVERLSFVVRRCRELLSVDEWPAILEDAGAAEAVHAGDLSSTRSLAELLYAYATEGSNPGPAGRVPCRSATHTLAPCLGQAVAAGAHAAPQPRPRRTDQLRLAGVDPRRVDHAG